MITRVDVLVLIACLGAGAVVAVPRHVRLATETRLDEVSALARSAALAAQLAHARWLAANEPPTVDGPRGVVAIAYGYPSTATLPLMLAEAETATFVYSSGVWRHGSVAGDRPCSVAYSPPAAPGKNPVISAQTSGC
jgi:type II secretory pathway pseudopilin PulG